MKKIVVLIVAVLFLTTLITAYDQERAQGLQDTKSKMRQMLYEVKSKQPANAYGDITYKTLQKVRMKLDSDYYNKTLMTDFTKSKTMEMLAQLAITSAFAVGTAEQDAQIKIVKDTSNSLSGSSDSFYQELAGKYSSLAKAMEEGNEIEAQTIAQDIKKYVSKYKPHIPDGYQASNEENNILAGLGGILANSLGRIGNMLSMFALDKLFTMLGWGALATNPLGLAVGIIMQETIGAIASGIGSREDIVWKNVEDTAVNQITGLAKQGVNSQLDKVQQGLDENLASTTPIIQPNRNTSTEVEESVKTGGNKLPQ